MKLQSLKLGTLAVGLVGAMLNAQAELTVVPTTGSFDGNPPGTLYTVMQSLLGSPTYDVNNPANRVNDSVDQVWNVGPTGASTMVLTIAGYSGVNAFGIYNLSNPNQMIQIFAGGTAPTTSQTITYNSGTGKITVGANSLYVGSDFGFYMATPGSSTGYWYSQESLNNDGGDHMVTLTTSTAETLTLQPGSGIPGASGQTVAWNPGSYLLGWEDLPVAGSGKGDVDYQDMLVEVTGFTPVPEPTTMLAGAMLLLPFGASALRILRKKSMA